jgi:HAD superfamily phosphatase (TIGR01668 family)
MLRHFCPRLVVSHLTELSPAFFAERGLQAVILDLDNTLVPWRGAEIAPEVSAWVGRCRAAGLKLCICSNTHRPRRLAQLAAELEVPFIERVAKPRRGGFMRALTLMGTSVAETAVVGDQLMTDIWGGNRCGLLTILVEPLSRVEFIGTRMVNRPLEAWLLSRMQRRGMLDRWSPVREPAMSREVDG